MSTSDFTPELREALGAMIFGAARPLSVAEMRKCLVEVAESRSDETSAFARVKTDDIRKALNELCVEFAKLRCGIELLEVAGGYRYQSAACCGKWLRHLLNLEKPNRLSQPGLETLAVIAYRQPVTRSEIEAVRGVNVDHVLKTLMEMQLVRIVGRSSLPGRPFEYGTTTHFLEHFGLKDLSALSQIDPMLAESQKHAKPGKETAAGAPTEEENES